MTSGVIDKYFDDRGFGFIKRDDVPGWKGIFFHLKNFPEDAAPAIGMAVEFEIAQGDRGDYATNIKVKPSAPIQFGDDMPPQAA